MGHSSTKNQPDSLIRRMESIAGLEPVWKRGVIHPGGPHYRLPGMAGPVSIGVDECELLGRMIAELRPRHAFLIGNGFGLSSAFIAKSMEAGGGESVITLDSMQEGDGTRCFQVAEQLRTSLGCRLLKNLYGVSPQDIDHAAEQEQYDFVFIDGDHTHPQVTRDFEGALRILSPGGVVAWHDHWLPGVAAAVEAARGTGFRCLQMPTSCEMVFGTRDGAVFTRLQNLFPEGQAPVSGPVRRARLVLLRAALKSILAR